MAQSSHYFRPVFADNLPAITAVYNSSTAVGAIQLNQGEYIISGGWAGIAPTGTFTPYGNGYRFDFNEAVENGGSYTFNPNIAKNGVTTHLVSYTYGIIPTKGVTTAGNDILVGSNRADVVDNINGGAGNDRFYGRNGNDNLSGGAGRDRIEGNDGNDTLKGDAGNDTLLGGHGNDRLEGGSGDDILIGSDGDNIYVGGAGDDYIKVGGNPTDEDVAFNTLFFRRGSGHDIVHFTSSRNDVRFDFDVANLDDNSLVEVNTGGRMAAYDFTNLGKHMGWNTVEAAMNIVGNNTELDFDRDGHVDMRLLGTKLTHEIYDGLH